TQNLAILANEYDLDESQRDVLITLFYDSNVSKEQFSELVLNGLLDDRLLVNSLSSGRLPRLGYTTLYAKDATGDSPRSEDTFLEYRASGMRRKEIRRELGIDTPAKLSAMALRQEQVLRMFDRSLLNTQFRDLQERDTLAATGS
ncbi:MAG: hypothetical protein ACJAZF_003163, partial [Granulosicoccus sp.]